MKNTYVSLFFIISLMQESSDSETIERLHLLFETEDYYVRSLVVHISSVHSLLNSQRSPLPCLRVNYSADPADHHIESVSIPLLLTPLSSAFGWTTEELKSMYSIYLELYAIFEPQEKHPLQLEAFEEQLFIACLSY